MAAINCCLSLIQKALHWICLGVLRSMVVCGEGELYKTVPPSVKVLFHNTQQRRAAAAAATYITIYNYYF